MEPLLEIGGHVLDSLTNVMERHARALVIAFLFVFLICVSFIGATKLLWYDEFLTYYPARMNLHDLLAFYRDALDTQTPIQALAIKASMSIFGDNHWAIRLPSLLAFALTCVGMYLFVERRLPRVYALAAMLFPAVTITLYFATEARPYSFLLAFSVLAMVCWQRASEEQRHWGWLAALGFCLTACIFSHYYAVLLWIPLGLAEIVRWRERGKPDLALWAVCLAALCSILIFLPTIRTVSHTYGGAILSSRLGIQRVQYTVLLARTLIPFPLLIGVGLLALLSRTARHEGSLLRDVPLSERVLVVSVAIMILFELPLALMLGQYGERYVVETVAGVGMVVIALMYWLASGDRRFGAALAILFFGWFVLKTASAVRGNRAESGGLPFHAAQPFRNTQWIHQLELSSLPFVATPAGLFMQLQFYASHELQSRIVYPFNDDAVRHSGHPHNDDKYMELWVPRIPIKAVPSESVMGPGSHFLMCVDTSNFSWQLKKLLQEHADLRLLTDEPPYLLFDVTVPQQSALK